jgi:hypothetical protein
LKFPPVHVVWWLIKVGRVVRKGSMINTGTKRSDIFLTSDKARVQIVPCAPHVRSHATVLFSAGDDVIRGRALHELKRLMDDEDSNGAVAVLMQYEEFKKNK